MGILNRGTAMAIFVGATLLTAGCNSANPAAGPTDVTNFDTPTEASETQRMAEAALGRQAEVVAHGDLARNGLEQILVVNRSANSTRDGGANSAVVLITRAAILQKSDGKWSEVLRCDDYVKNPYGYLGGSTGERVTGWRLEYAPATSTEMKSDSGRRFELKFTPVTSGESKQDAEAADPAGRTLVVRWNSAAKRYQSMDRTHERFLSEDPTLGTPQSILK
jgi:hypothetical protein